jgi:choline dehydrogenase
MIPDGRDRDVTEHYDVLVIGGGSAGSVAAARLSEDPACRVLMLEAGADFSDESRTPGFFFGEIPGPPVPDMDWAYMSEPVRGTPRPLTSARLVGGGSMINGCIAVRGRPEDFALWEDAGATGWNWNDVLPYYEAVEREIMIRIPQVGELSPFHRAAIDGFQELGYRFVEDMNQPNAWNGVVGPWPQNRVNGERKGSLTTYLRRARSRPNLTIRDHSLVDRVLFKGTRAVGASYLGTSTRRAVTVRADRVILSAGAYNTPTVLMRSGIGPASRLGAVGVKPILDLPVGTKLMCHASTEFLITGPRELTRFTGPHLGMVARNSEWFIIPIVTDEVNGACAVIFARASLDGDGTVTLKSTKPDDPPLIDHQLEMVIDRGEFESGWREFQALLATKTLASKGARNADSGRRPADFIADRIKTAGHHAGTCGIGRVIDPELRVYGAEGLYVADASSFPRHVSNNPNLTCFMIGERVAAGISGRKPTAAGYGDPMSQPQIRTQR